MLGNIKFDAKSKTPLYLQISAIIIQQIESGQLKKDTLLPSINVFNEQYNVARDTAEKAYKELKKKGYIIGVIGKGYFVTGKQSKTLKVLFIFNKISSFKKIIYYSFLEALGSKAIVDIQVHHYKPLLLKDIVEHHLGKYNYYVIMPHFEIGTKPKAYLDVLKHIPENQLLLLDKSLPDFPNAKSVYQDFTNDIYDALLSAKALIQKYNALVLVLPEESNHPLGIIKGAQQFADEQQLAFQVLPDTASLQPVKATLYITVSDDDLVVLVKRSRQSALQLGKDIGIISFNETELKDLLDIAVISTNFEQMGKTAASLLLTHTNAQIRNPFRMIQRGSL